MTAADSASRSSSIYTSGNAGGESLTGIWNPGQLVPDGSPSEQFEDLSQTISGMSVNGADSLSSDSGPTMNDRFMQRRLQRLNTEQGFREQRQASQSQAQAQAQHSKSLSLAQADFHHQQAQQQQSILHHSDQPLPSRIPSQVIPSVPASTATTPSSSSASPHSHFRHDTPQQPQYQPLRNFAKLHDDGPIHLSTSPSKATPRQPSMASSNQSPAPTARDPSILSQQQPQQSKDVGRSTPQPQAEDLTEDQIRQLLNDHKELRKPSYNSLRLESLLIVIRRKIPKGQEVLFRKGGPGQATAKQSRPPTNRSVAHFSRRRRICDPLQPPRRPDRAIVIQH